MKKKNRKKQHDKELNRMKKQSDLERLNKAWRDLFVKAGVLNAD